VKAHEVDLERFKVIFGFDMETDIGSWTPFYQGLLKGTPRVLNLLSKHNITATFYFVADSARLHPEVVRTVKKAGCEIGCHSLYHETLGDEIIPIPGLRSILQEECFHRIEVATNILEDILGEKIVSFRAPRLWGSTSMVNALEDLGYRTDASYPMFYYKDRLVPYHPSRQDWLMEGDMKLVEIPNFADMTMKSNTEDGRDRDQWPLFRTEGAKALIHHIDAMLKYYRELDLPAVLCFYFHPWEFYQMPQGSIHFGEGSVTPDQFIVKNCGETAVKELEELILMLKDRNAEFIAARQISSIL
jgi:peptidoglycan-N-acetylglucosamine deacetylase